MVFSFGALAQSVRAADSLAISNNGLCHIKETLCVNGVNSVKG